jgi:hypothetical protein
MDDTTKNPHLTGPRSYPGETEPDDELVRQRPRWKTVLVIAIVVLLVAVFIILHLTGVVGAKTNM